MKNFSILTSVYKNDKPELVKKALDSLVDQTIKPNEIVLVIDGPISDEVENVLKIFKEKNKELVIIKLEKNGGLGNALNIGLQNCKNEIVARMDADDISLPNRFEIQLKTLVQKDLDIVGGQIAEFIDDETKPIAIRKTPLSEKEIKAWIKSRNPFNHVTVMFKKQSVVDAGGYQHLYYAEDYFLWCRMFLAGSKMENVPEVLVKCRMNKDSYKRRGGYKYFKSLKTLYKFLKAKKAITTFQYLKNLFIRFSVHVLMPNKLREKFYFKKLRQKIDSDSSANLKNL